MERWQKVAIVFLTSKSSPEARAAAFKAGGDDFLNKPILTEELLARVRAQLEISSTLKERAGIVPWSGLLTRRAFENILPSRIEHARTTGSSLSVAFVTIDSFQEIALSYGFLFQQILLKDLTDLLQTRFRVSDLCAEWLDSSFVIAANNVDVKVFCQALTQLATDFRERTSCEQNIPRSKRKLRFGVAELIDDGIDSAALLNCAYQRMMVSN